MKNQASSERRRAQKESILRKELSKLFLDIKLNDPNFEDIFINRVHLTPDKGTIHVFFYTDQGEEYFKEKLPLLILYKPSIRKALSQLISSRYTPQIIFKYDSTFEKQRRLETLLDKVKEEE